MEYFSPGICVHVIILVQELLEFWPMVDVDAVVDRIKKRLEHGHEPLQKNT